MKPNATDVHDSPASDTLYDTDFFAWTEQTAALIRAARFAEIDVENTAEEIESLGRRERNELNSRMQVLLQHLLKWTLQPDRGSSSWEVTILTQRFEIADRLRDSPSLRPTLTRELPRNYARAVKRAATETSLGVDRFPLQCPFTVDEILDDDFLPS
jgi:hypothetical protein